MAKVDDNIFKSLVNISSRLGTVVINANKNRDTNSNKQNLEKLRRALDELTGLKEELESMPEPSDLTLQNAKVALLKTMETYVKAFNYGLQYCQDCKPEKKDAWENHLVAGNCGCIAVGGFITDYGTWQWQGKKESKMGKEKDLSKQIEKFSKISDKLIKLVRELDPDDAVALLETTAKQIRELRGFPPIASDFF